MTTKMFDAVKLMRELRDRLSLEMEGMTAEERMQYVRERAVSSGLRVDLAQQGGAREPDEADGPTRDH